MSSFLKIFFAAVLLSSVVTATPAVVCQRDEGDETPVVVGQMTTSSTPAATRNAFSRTRSTKTIFVTATPSSNSSVPLSTPRTNATTNALPRALSTKTIYVTATPSENSSGATSSPTGISGKRGLAYNDPHLTQPFSGQGSKISWAYNWASLPYSSGQPTTGFNPALEFVPILWSNAQGATSVWSANVKSCISQYGTKAVLAFNEPDQCGNGGSCMKMQDSVSAYQTYMMPLKGTVSLGAPAVTNGGAPMGLTYLKTFMSACINCHFDFFPIHWYGAASDTAGFEAHVGEAYAAVGNKPLWVTEFGTTSGSPEDVQNFLQTVSKWMDESEMVARYSFFMDGPGYLIEANGTELSPLGKLYNSA